jgi:uncharacterized protein YndB with AHSA1/START domain
MTNRSFDPGPLADVDTQIDDGRWTLVYARDFRHPPAKVWAALTRADQLSAWTPFRTARDLTEEGPLTLSMIDGETTVDLPATVRRVEPLTCLEYTWGPDVLRWELVPTETGTRLTLFHTVQDRDWVPKVAAGWHLCLLVADHLMDGQPIAPIRGQDAMNYGWSELNDAYADKLGIPSSGFPEEATS